MTSTRLFILPLLTLLAACDNGGDAAGPERKTAAGEVLGGSISDAMLPLDTAQSQSPPLRESSVAQDGDEPEASSDDDKAPSVAPSPSASSSPSATPEAASAPPPGED